jgi:carbamoyltransferase
MRTILGIHPGHHASCAVVKDGTVAAALQQERITRVKHDGQEGLSNRLPVREALQAARTSLDEVNLIVSSFQAPVPAPRRRTLASPSPPAHTAHQLRPTS